MYMGDMEKHVGCRGDAVGRTRALVAEACGAAAGTWETVRDTVVLCRVLIRTDQYVRSTSPVEFDDAAGCFQRDGTL